jgi:GNAT superfamily N-acetyltransferase
MSSFTIRAATEADCPRILELVQELAIYEKAPEQVIATVDEIRRDGFGPNPVWFGQVAVDENDTVQGMALCYVRYSTWKGAVLYLEDLIVTEALRGKGAGKKLFEWCIEETKRRGFRRMAWQVLEWNTPSIEFYKRYGAKLDAEWLNATIDV